MKIQKTTEDYENKLKELETQLSPLVQKAYQATDQTLLMKHLMTRTRTNGVNDEPEIQEVAVDNNHSMF